VNLCDQVHAVFLDPMRRKGNEEDEEDNEER